MKTKSFLTIILPLTFCWTRLAYIKAKGSSPAAKNSFSVKPAFAKPDSRYPFSGYYEAHATYTDKGSTSPQIVEAPTDLRWFRLYKDGTYRTNEVNGEEHKGHYIFNIFNAQNKSIIIKSGLLKSYIEGQDISFYQELGHFPRIAWLGPGECMTDCYWKRR